MRRLLAITVILFAAAAVFAANGYRKSYFGATPVGAWAKYRSTTSYGNTADAMRRLTDDQGRVRYSYQTEYLSGQFKGTKSKNTYTFNKSYPADRDGLDYMKYIAAGSAEYQGKKMEFEEAALEGIRKVPEYGPALVFEATETVNGKETDRYSYTINTPTGPETGKYWLSDKVPFGVVKHTSTGKDATGKVSTIEQVLADSGVSVPPPDEPKAKSRKSSKKN
ncbi:MAG TPA: hypothetical protein VLV78_05020 [Thermoanaerobaculia bacterium]|nr:hypothetical protein [Thermoanaerobaculia bacterium]